MNTAPLAAALLRAMIAIAPPAKLAALPSFEGWSETAAEREDRYRGIADAAARASKGDRHDAAIILGFTYHESGWARDVDLGPCYRGKDGKGPRCDYGRAACLGQIRVDAHPEYTAAELFGDRDKCFAAVLKLAHASARACVKLGPDHGADVYAGGACVDGLALGQTAHKRGLELLALVARMEGLAK